MQATCPGTIVTGAGGELLCQDGNGATVAWVAEPAFDVALIDSAHATAAFAAGFVIAGTVVVFGRVARAVISPILKRF